VKVLITGSAGFIGSHLAESLLADGHTVVGIDNFDPFYDRSVKEANLADIRAGGGDFRFVEADIRDADAVDALFADEGPFDAIAHLAARAGVRPSIEDPMLYEQVNMAGTINLLAAATRAETMPKFIFGSSSSVYGNNEKLLFSEADSVDFPISPYAATKRSGELMAHVYHRLYGLDVWCLRFFTVYGPRQRPDLAIHKFARKILAGESIPKFGDGSASRDYTYISDIVAGVRAAIDRCSGYEIINLGSRNPVTLTDMIATVAAACGREPIVEQLPMQPGDVNCTYADVAKAGELLDYAPSMPFADGVAALVDWLRRRMTEDA